jgi:hypothetical protein
MHFCCNIDIYRLSVIGLRICVCCSADVLSIKARFAKKCNLFLLEEHGKAKEIIKTFV